MNLAADRLIICSNDVELVVGQLESSGSIVWALMSTWHLFHLYRHLLSGFSTHQVGYLVDYIMHVMWAPGVRYPFMSYRYELLFVVLM